MGESDFKAIESDLGLPLPASYRRVMERYPLDAGNSNSAIALIPEAQAVVGINRELRQGEFARDWRPGWFAIGTSPSGDMYFLDLSEKLAAVYSWDHETHDVVEDAPDLDTFLRHRAREESIDGLG